MPGEVVEQGFEGFIFRRRLSRIRKKGRWQGRPARLASIPVPHRHGPGRQAWAGPARPPSGERSHQKVRWWHPASPATEDDSALSGIDTGMRLTIHPGCSDRRGCWQSEEKWCVLLPTRQTSVRGHLFLRRVVSLAVSSDQEESTLIFARRIHNKSGDANRAGLVGLDLSGRDHGTWVNSIDGELRRHRNAVSQRQPLIAARSPSLDL